MRELVRLILDCLLEVREIPEELLYELSKTTVMIVEQRCMEEIPEEFWELESYVEAYWRGEKYKKTDDMVRVYQMGQLLSFTNMLCMLTEQQEKERLIDDYAVRSKDSYHIFEEIYVKPGIAHKDLAIIAGLDTVSLTQFLNEYKLNGFIQSRSMGCEKHYYLTDHGKKLYSVMKVNHKKEGLSCSAKPVTGVGEAFYKWVRQNCITDCLELDRQQSKVPYVELALSRNSYSEKKMPYSSCKKVPVYDNNEMSEVIDWPGYKEENRWGSKKNLNRHAIKY